ncbi:MAG: cyclic nucleotide-binding domain-containing protein [Leptolyngbyaceae cyanobacterium SM1_4_3]|nr:cyclic nucleotide-binding domain-containing protein [Leptolyngbyaceae cyanobacterium SM1_4_3]
MQNTRKTSKTEDKQTKLESKNIWKSGGLNHHAKLRPKLLFYEIGQLSLFLAFIVLITGGNLSGFTLTLSFCLGTAFVAWNKTKKYIRMKQLNQLNLASRGTSEERIVVEVFHKWKELYDNDRAWLISTGQREQVSKGETLIEEGEAVDALYVVLSGELEVCISALGDEKIAMLSAGDVVGEMSFVRKRLPSATVRSLEDSVVWSIPAHLYQRSYNRIIILLPASIKLLLVFFQIGCIPPHSCNLVSLKMKKQLEGF